MFIELKRLTMSALQHCSMHMNHIRARQIFPHIDWDNRAALRGREGGRDGGKEILNHDYKTKKIKKRKSLKSTIRNYWNLYSNYSHNPWKLTANTL